MPYKSIVPSTPMFLPKDKKRKKKFRVITSERRQPEILGLGGY